MKGIRRKEMGSFQIVAMGLINKSINGVNSNNGIIN